MRVRKFIVCLVSSVATTAYQVMVWEVNAVRRPDRPIAALHTLTGHDDVVTCVAASPMLDLVVSASQVIHGQIFVRYIINRAGVTFVCVCGGGGREVFV